MVLNKDTSILASCMAWISYLNALSLSFCICKMGTIIVTFLQGAVICIEEWLACDKHLVNMS